MGSNPIATTAHGGAGGLCRWRNKSGGSGNNNNSDSRVLPSPFAFFFFSFVLLGSIAGLYVHLLLTPNVHAALSTSGCREDNEGSWAIGVFYGDSPFSLKPIEDVSFTFSIFLLCFACFQSKVSSLIILRYGPEFLLRLGTFGLFAFLSLV